MTADTLPVASAPCSFGVDEVLVDDAWMPGPDEMLDWMVELGYAGTELGPPGYLGIGEEVCRRLQARNLDLVGAFLPQHFSRSDRAAEDRDWLQQQLTRLRAATPPGSAPFAVLSEAIDEPERRRWSGRIDEHPEARLGPERIATLVDNLHRAGEACRALGFEAVIHPHAGTYLETAEEIDRVMERLNPSLVGLCLDTGHFRYGGAEPARAVRDYAGLLRHVHVKDCRTSVLDQVRAADGGLTLALELGVFTELGAGDSDIPAVIESLRAVGYQGWLVVEQDQHLTTAVTREMLVAGQGRNRDYLRALGV
jgi:inosose dehydratase